jgi:hypothetical protein
MSSIHTIRAGDIYRRLAQFKDWLMSSTDAVLEALKTPAAQQQTASMRLPLCLVKTGSHATPILSKPRDAAQPESRRC